MLAHLKRFGKDLKYILKEIEMYTELEILQDPKKYTGILKILWAPQQGQFISPLLHDMT